MTWDVGALLLGLAVVIALALLTSPLAEQTDESMVWEGRVAVGFAALAFVGPFWIAQGVATTVAAFADGGVRPGWLWAWFVAAPLLGASPPAASLARAVRSALRRREPVPSPRAVAAVQQEANFAWAATEADPTWLLRRTPPLPESWPPHDGGAAVWLCYAERPGPAGSVEVAAPWARITLAQGSAAWPVVHRLAETVESLGVQPVSDEPSTKHGPLLDAVYRGDPKARVAKHLGQWLIRNGVLAAHPAVAPHLPPGQRSTP